MAAQNFTNLGFLKIHADLKAVTRQSNKIVSNEMKDYWALLEPSYGKIPNELFGQPNLKKK